MSLKTKPRDPRQPDTTLAEIAAVGTTPLGKRTNQSHLGRRLHTTGSATVRMNSIISLFPSRSLNDIWFRGLIAARLRAYSVVYTSNIELLLPFLSVNLFKVIWS